VPEPLTTDEFVAIVCAREIRAHDKVGVGVVSPVATAAALLAQRLHAPQARYDVPRLARSYFRGSHEMTGYANQGRVDVFFLSAAQVDARASINLEYVGDSASPKKRFFGAFAAPVYYATMRRIILFLPEHSPRVFVERVDRKTAVACSAAGFRRNGGIHRIVTPRAVLAYDASDQRLTLVSAHPGETIESVQAATGFQLRPDRSFGTTPLPTADELRLMRGEVRDVMAGLFPGWGSSPKTAE